MTSEHVGFARPGVVVENHLHRHTCRASGPDDAPRARRSAGRAELTAVRLQVRSRKQGQSHQQVNAFMAGEVFPRESARVVRRRGEGMVDQRPQASRGLGLHALLRLLRQEVDGVALGVREHAVEVVQVVPCRQPVVTKLTLELLLPRLAPVMALLA